MNALEVRGVTVRFGGVVAVDEVNLAVAPGEVIALVGPNGSGKTSLLDAISGFEPYSGSVALQGQRVDGLPAHARARRGLARTFQALELSDDLTVGESVRVGRRVALDPNRVDAHTRVAALDNAQRRALALERALAGEVAVLLLDEIAAGLDDRAQARVCESILGARSRDTAVVVVDHDIDFVVALADRAVVLDRGRLLFDGDPAAIRTHPDVVAAYLGDVS